MLCNCYILYVTVIVKRKIITITLCYQLLSYACWDTFIMHYTIYAYMSQVFKKLIEAMQQRSPLFKKMYRRILWGGSYYKNTRVGEPQEYDLNLVLILPFKEEDIIVILFSNLI